MGVVGIAGIAIAPLAVALTLAPCLLLYLLRSMPAPVRSIEGPPRFTVDTGSAAKRRFYTVAPADMCMAVVPGLLPWRYGHRDAAVRQAALGGAGLVALSLWGETSSIARFPALVAYLSAYNLAMQTVREGDAAERWMAFAVGLDADMARAECDLPSCPRCRLRDRDASGWCGVCHAALTGRTLPADDWRARVGSRSELQLDGRLFPLCARRMTRSYIGSGGERYEIARKARRSGVPIPAPPRGPSEPAHEVAVEVAYADPARADLVWVRTRERLALAAGGAYETRRVEAWGFVDGVFAQAWVFGPVTRCARGDAQPG